MILTMEGTMYPSYEDEYGIPATTDADENPVSAEDEAYYCDYILSGQADEDEQDFGDYAEDMYDPDGYEADRACDRWERHFWGD